jgi:hypothetical protein
MVAFMKFNISKCFLVCILITAISCSSNIMRVYLRVNEALEGCNDNNRCELKMSEITWFEWDSMYYFSGSVYLDEISEILGSELDCYIDIGARLVFVKNDKVVYCEEYFPYPTSGAAKGIIIESDQKFLMFTNENASFEVIKKGKFYYLVPAGRESSPK